jgi:zinc transporter 9
VTQNPLWDSVGSIIVGLLLGGVAIYLVLANRSLLMGKAVPDGVELKFVEVLRKRASVRGVHDVKTRQLTPEVYKLKAEVTFDADYLAGKLGAVLPEGGAALTGAARDEALRALASCALRTLSVEIDSIEEAVRAEIPEAKHIDIEVDHAREGGEPRLDR